VGKRDNQSKEIKELKLFYKTRFYPYRISEYTCGIYKECVEGKKFIKEGVMHLYELRRKMKIMLFNTWDIQRRNFALYCILF
jgi:hypothetical protein